MTSAAHTPVIPAQAGTLRQRYAIGNMVRLETCVDAGLRRHDSQ